MWRGFHSGTEITAMVSSSEFFSEESPAAARSKLSGFTKVRRDGTWKESKRVSRLVSLCRPTFAFCLAI